MGVKILQIIVIIMGGISLFGSVILGFVGIFYPSFKIPAHPFDSQELNELKNFYNMNPINNLIESNNSDLFNDSHYYPLFGKYKGLKGGHEYQECSTFFEGTCREARQNKDYESCNSEYGPDKLDWSTCVDFIPIPEINYTFYSYKQEKYYYKEKAEITYEKLLEMSVSEKEKCPENKKSCGFLNTGLILCYNFDEECPINDIVINSLPNYSDNEITYKAIKLDENEYIHFTNEKIDNKIIFDFLLSIEHPLSKIELSKNDKSKKIFKLNIHENEQYFKGNIDYIKSIKQIYNTKITYRQLLELYGIYDTIISEPYYKTRYLSSNIFIYTKNAIPVLNVKYEEIEKFNKDYFVSYVLNYISASILFIIFIPFWLPFGKQPLKIVINCFIIEICFVGVISLFFFLKIESLTNTKIFKDNDIFKDKNTYRISILSLHATYFSMGILTILTFIIYKISEKQVEAQRNIDYRLI